MRQLFVRGAASLAVLLAAVSGYGWWHATRPVARPHVLLRDICDQKQMQPTQCGVAPLLLVSYLLHYLHYPQ